VIPQDYHRSVPGAWTQTPIAARFARVPTVPVLRNDHWMAEALQSWIHILVLGCKPAPPLTDCPYECIMVQHIA